jgi:NADH-quinone oxidoreductase subunit M
MIDWPILSLTTFLPLLGVVFVLMVSGNDDQAKGQMRMVALVTTGMTFGLSLVIWAFFDYSNPGFQFVEERDWLGSNISYKMGVDGISLLFVVLTAFLMPFCILASWKSVQNRVREYMVAFLILETLMIGVFCALDIVSSTCSLRRASSRCS